ncbi:MAG: transcription termination/antitermination factor NusG [Oscillospiraceae bacterium]|jgi:transcriptional antiterminator NusG|nr:transcription termination/antitermination factor NusG [Oscillospiraceae bacterium]
MSETARWYVVHTYSGYENKVAQNIEKVVENQGFGDRIFEVRVPTEQVVEYKDGKERTVERKTYPGYVLVKMIQTPESWYVVRNIRGVTGFVGSTTEPIPLTDKEVEALGVETKSVQVNYAVGDEVKIIRGPLEDYLGRVEEILPEKDLVKVTVSFFGRDTLYELGLGDVRLAEK